MRDEDEIQAMADAASTASMKPTKYQGSSYEDGVRNALDWALDETMPSPLEEDDDE